MRYFLKCWILPILYYWGFPERLSQYKKLEFKTPNLEFVRTLFAAMVEAFKKVVLLFHISENLPRTTILNPME